MLILEQNSERRKLLPNWSSCDWMTLNFHYQVLITLNLLHHL